MTVSVSIEEDFPEIRDGVRRICADFPNEYWRTLDETEAYPKNFVDALTKARYLGALIPEEYGGAGMGFRWILDGMNAERILVSHESVGDARWFVRVASRYASEHVLGMPRSY